MYYWSDSKKVNEDNYKIVEWKKSESISLIYQEQNLEPQTIYLHIKKIGIAGDTTEVIPFKNYINKLLTIEPEETEFLTNTDSKFMFQIKSNRFTQIETIFVQLSENALLSHTPQQQLKYRYLGIFNGKESHNYTLDLDLQDYNVIDGAYFLKVSVKDTAGVVTELYSQKINVDFDVISKLIQFDSPVIGNNGQIVSKSDIQLTGNTLIETEFVNNLDLNEAVQSKSYLTLTKDIDEAEKLNIRKFNGMKVTLFKLIAHEDKKQYLIEADIKVPNDWYLLYYEDSFIGAFLYQSTRGN